MMSHNGIVLGGHTSALHVVRSLGRSGLKVAVLDDKRYSEARFSRFCTHFRRVDRLTAEALHEQLHDLESTLGPCVIYPTTDETVRALAEISPSLGGGHVPMIPDWPITEIAYDKSKTYDLAIRCDVPIPETFYPQSMEEMRQIASRCRYPVLLKPTTTVRFRSAFGKKAVLAESEDELTRIFTEISAVLSPSDLLIQEFIGGSNAHFWDYVSVFWDGCPAFAAVIERRRQYPVDFGTATHSELGQNSRVAELGARFLSSMGYWGVSSVQFKYDVERDEYFLLDVNPRFWKSCRILDHLSVNMPTLAASLRLGQATEITAADRAERLIWIDLLPEIYVSLRDIFRGDLSIRDWWQSYDGRLVDATFSREDPVPAIVLALTAPILYLRGVS